MELMNMVMIRAALIFSWKTFFYRWLNLREIAATLLHSLDRCPNKHSALPIGKVAASNWKGPLQNEKNRLLSTRTIPEKRHIRMKCSIPTSYMYEEGILPHYGGQKQMLTAKDMAAVCRLVV